MLWMLSFRIIIVWNSITCAGSTVNTSFSHTKKPNQLFAYPYTHKQSFRESSKSKSSSPCGIKYSRHRPNFQQVVHCFPLAVWQRAIIYISLDFPCVAKVNAFKTRWPPPIHSSVVNGKVFILVLNFLRKSFWHRKKNHQINRVSTHNFFYQQKTIIFL